MNRLACCSCKKRIEKKKESINVSPRKIDTYRKFFSNDIINVGDKICLKCVRLESRKKPNRSLQFSSDIENDQQTDDSHIDNELGTQQSNSEIPAIEHLESQPLCSKNLLSQSLEQIDEDFISENNENNDIENCSNNIMLNKNKSFGWLRTSNGSQKYCIICKEKNRKNRVKKESIAYAYRYHRIIIRPDSRCCSKHLDEKGLILPDQFDFIETTPKQYFSETIKIFDSLLTCNNNKIFDNFYDLSLVDDKLCFQITGWNKKEFIEFSKYIKSIKNNIERTKTQLIALYRYWLRKGTDQCTLSHLFTDKNQQEISNYLNQIRTAINNDFVPLFLGANKDREFYLKHNTKSVIELHELRANDLAIVADASYIRLEKSSNNNFQYLSYSMQKKQNLLKPFIICCADGYFIDCYGPFQANLNDATILEYLLKVDVDLKNLLLENETIIFLDRGFRDVQKKLINEYKLNVKIPNCKQYNDDNQNCEIRNKNILTTEESNNNRMVTKVIKKIL